MKVNVLIRMSDVKSIKTNNDRKLYQHQMLLSESKFELQSIKVDQEDDQKSDSDLTQILLRFDSELKQESKINEDSIKEVISIQNQIIVENQMNQLCIDIQAALKQNRRICQDIDLNNCRVLDEVL